ncbi:MAG: alpha/beta fold hydrolase [Alphaproteobacteria bacterium]|nr:alpha/beta fold hydrolase [Alphaproteobacteria bacterium]
MTARPTRRALLAGAAAFAAPSLALGQQPAPSQPAPTSPAQRRAPADPAGSPPIVFVHGNGDSAALWINNLWRFEANGYRRNQLFAIDFSYPLARSDDSQPQALRSSTADAMKELAAFVTQVRNTTKRRKVALIASSRGGNTVRNYLKNGGGAPFVSHAILCGTPNKGIVISDTMLVGSEFNGASPFLKDLNGGPDDLIAGVEMMAIRSDKNDKYSQPDARFVGFPGKPTGVGYDASELRGAKNVVLDGLDHHEIAFHKLAFAAQYEFIVGKPAGTMFIAQEALPTLNGRVEGIAEGSYTNLPVAGAEVEIYDVDARTGERKSERPVHRKVTAADGLWGPFVAHGEASYEFQLKLDGQPTTHIYRAPFLRSSDIVHLRVQPFAKGEETAEAVVIMARPRGYFGVGRDKFSLDGKVPPGINDGVPGTASGRLPFEAKPRTVIAVFNNETIAARTWAAKANHIAVAEFTN